MSMPHESIPTPSQEERDFDRLVDAGVYTPGVARAAVGLQVEAGWDDISGRLAHPASGMDPRVFRATTRRTRPTNPGTDRDLDPIDSVEDVLVRRPIELSQKGKEEKDLLSASLLWSKALRSAKGNTEMARAVVDSSNYTASGNKRDIL